MELTANSYKDSNVKENINNKKKKKNVKENITPHCDSSQEYFQIYIY